MQKFGTLETRSVHYNRDIDDLRECWNSVNFFGRFAFDFLHFSNICTVKLVLFYQTWIDFD